MRRTVSSIRRVKQNFLRTVSPQKSLRAKKARCREHRAFFAQRPSPLTSRGRTRVEGDERASLYEGAHAHAHRIVRAHIRADEAQLRSLCFLSPSLPPIGAVPGAPPATHASTHRHAASAKHQQHLALAGLTLSLASTQEYMLLAFTLVLKCTGWRSMHTRLCRASYQRASRRNADRRITCRRRVSCRRAYSRKAYRRRSHSQSARR